MFFIVGSARSGTTLLRLILNAHSRVAVPPESRFITELYQGDRVDRDHFLQRLESHSQFQHWKIPIDDVRRQLGGDESVAYADAILAAYRAYAGLKGKSLFGDKTPRYVTNIPRLSRLFPDARFVHQIRDGRNVALSYADVPFGPKTIGHAAALWAERVAAGFRDGRALGPDRYTEVRYEDFVTNPEALTKTLCDFIGIDFEEQMLDHAEQSRSDVLPRASRYNPNVTKPPTQNIRSWEDQMPARQVEMFEAIAGDVIEAAGYERQFPQPPASARALANLSRWRLPIGRLVASGKSPRRY
ncbi:MAG: sulfotransferase [Actinomycetota bacterium]|nr:sulfotransferase [Actinomycetota bacterium]